MLLHGVINTTNVYFNIYEQSMAKTTFNWKAHLEHIYTDYLHQIFLIAATFISIHKHIRSAEALGNVSGVQAMLAPSPNVAGMQHGHNKL